PIEFSSLSLHDALPISRGNRGERWQCEVDRLPPIDFCPTGCDELDLADGCRSWSAKRLAAPPKSRGNQRQPNHGRGAPRVAGSRSEEHTSELQSRENLV